MMPAPIDFATVALGVAERRWRPFPGLQETKVPAMRGWPGLNEAEWDCMDLIAAVAEYQPAAEYCCCLAVQSEIVAIDIDITNPEHADTAANLADDQLGKTPLVRIGLAPKCVRIYRNGGGVRSRKLHPLEVYSGSGQIVGFGWHQKAGRPYLWPNASPLDLNADSAEIPAVTQAQLNRFTNELFKFVPRRLLPTQHGRRGNQVSPQTIGDRLRMLSTRYGSWRHAAGIVLSEAAEGCRNETAWAVVASAAGRGIPEDVVWQLFDKHFSGWDGFSKSALASAIERTRPVYRPSSLTFTARASEEA
jgi:Bifunctional DNA primase/polymerase, N-terminal